MPTILQNRDKIFSFIVWSFFSFSVLKFFSIFIYSLNHVFIYDAILCSLLFLIYSFIFKARFHSALKYWQYMTSNVLFVILITLLSYAYFKLIMLDNDYFGLEFFIAILISNLVLGSPLFLFTKIKRK